MPTRYYFPATASNTTGLTPSFDAGWQTNAEAVRAELAATKGPSAITAGVQIGPWTATAGQSALDRQWIGPQLAAQTISGTFSLMLMVREFAGTDNVDQIHTGVFVVNSSGTKVHTLKAKGNSGTTLEFVANATHRTHTAANAVALTSYSCAAGDRIVVEIGYANSTGGTTPEASAKWGENATDATLGDNATTADRAGWVEFSATLAPNSTPVLAGSITSAATSSTVVALLLGFVMGVISSVSQSVTSLLALLGILSSPTSTSASATSVSSTVESVTPVDAGTITSVATTSTTVVVQTGFLTGTISSSSTSSTTVSSTVQSLVVATAPRKRGARGRGRLDICYGRRR